MYLTVAKQYAGGLSCGCDRISYVCPTSHPQTEGLFTEAPHDLVTR